MKRKWWLAIIITIVVIVTAPLLALKLFHKDIVRIAQEKVNERIQGHVTFTDVDLGIWKHFPRISLRVNGLTVISKDLPSDTLLTMERGSFSFDTWEYLHNDHIRLARVHLVKPVFNALIKQNGTTNFAIIKPGDSTAIDTTSTKFSFNIKTIQIDDGSFRFRDELDETKTRITGLNFTGSGNFADDEFELTTKLSAESASLFVAGNPYFRKKKLDLELLVRVDMLRNIYHIDKSDLVVNNFHLALAGDVNIRPGRYGFDLKFDAPGSTLKDMLSLVRMFENDMEGITTNGVTSFSGFVKGDYVPGTDSIPAFEAKLNVVNGSFKMANSTHSVQNVQFGMVVTNKAGIIDSTDFRIDTLLARINEHEVKGHAHIFKLANSRVDASLSGTFTMEEILSVYPISGLKASGVLDFNIKASGYYKEFSATAPLPEVEFRISIADGFMKYDSLSDSLSNVNFRARGHSPQGSWQKASLAVDHLKMNIGANPIEGDFTLSNLTTPDIHASLKGRLNIEDVLRVFPIDSVAMKGIVAVEAKIDGKYDTAAHIFPNVDVQFAIKDGYFKTGYYQEALESINLMATLKNQGGKLESTSLDIERFRFKVADEKLFVKGSINDFKVMNYDLFVKGNIDLDKMSRIYPTPGYTFSGMLGIDVEVKGKIEDLMIGKYKRTKSEGTIRATEVFIRNMALPQDIFVRKAVVRLAPDMLYLDSVRFESGHTALDLDGQIQSYFSFFGNHTRMSTAKLNLTADMVDLNQWKDAFTTTDRSITVTTEKKQTSAWMIPANVDMTFVSNLKAVKYEDMELTGLDGVIRINDRVLTMNETGFNSLNARFTLDGSYDSRNIDHPLFDFKFNVDKLDIQKAYREMKLVRELLPAAEAATGLFSLEYNLKGELDSSMYPRAKTLNGGGEMRIAEATINGMKVFERLSRAAKRKELNDPKLKDFSMKTEIKNNRVYVKPFLIKVSGFNAEIEGVNEIEGDRMDYLIRLQLLPFDKAKIPFNVSGTYDNPKVGLGKGYRLPEEEASSGGGSGSN